MSRAIPLLPFWAFMANSVNSFSCIYLCIMLSLECTVLRQTRHSMHASQLQMPLFAQTHSALHIRSVVHANITQYLSSFFTLRRRITERHKQFQHFYFDVL